MSLKEDTGSSGSDIWLADWVKPSDVPAKESEGWQVAKVALHSHHTRYSVLMWKTECPS